MRWIKKYLFVVAMLLSCSVTYSQYYTNQNKVWVFGYSAKVDFNSGTPVSSTSTISAVEGCASVSDVSGNLLFYTDNANIYTAAGTVMPNGASVVPYSTVSTTQGSLIVPVFTNPNQYYVFLLEQAGSMYGRLGYVIVDMSLNGGLGIVVPFSYTPLATGLSEKMTATLGENCDIWVVTHKRGSNEIRAYNVSAAGISSPVISFAGTGTATDAYSTGTMKISPNGRKLAVSGHAAPWGLELLDFNDTTGVASNCQVLDNSNQAYGIEFSPDNSKLYANAYPGTSVVEFDLSLSSTSLIVASRTNVASSMVSGIGDLKLAPDNKIYSASHTGYMDCFSTPNGMGATLCGLTLHAVTLASSTTGSLGLPNIVMAAHPHDTFYTHHDTTLCLQAGTTAGITTHDSMSSYGYFWDNGTTTRTRTISAPGTYYAYIYYGCVVQVDTIHAYAYPQVGAITGTRRLCAGISTTLSDTSSGGLWSTTVPAVATIGSATGFVAGVAAGTTTITYRLTTTGCAATATVTVDPLPGSITGVPAMCVGSTTLLADTSTGGVWSSGSPGVAAVGSLIGLVGGLTAGVAAITYTLPTGCIATRLVTVHPLPAPISGAGSVCAGSTIGLSDATPGGVWSSTPSGIATTGSGSGVITGVTAGIANVTYTLPATGCAMTKTITVNALPAAITGSMAICPPGTTLLADATPGGTWSSGTPSIATIGSSSGIVTGTLAGATVISYTLPTGCRTTATFTVIPVPLPITGAAAVCYGMADTLTDAVPGGTWSSTDMAVADVGTSTGIVSGMGIGTAIISYTLPGGCYTTLSVTVVPAPMPVTGVSGICTGSTTLLIDGVSGGIWSSGAPGVATVGSSTGIVTGVSGGSAVITYATAPGCTATMTVSVTPLPLPITGSAHACQGAGTTLSDAVPGGVWTSSNTTIASVGSSSGIVSGTGIGIATITYATGSGCFVTKTFTVDPMPAGITGPGTVCVGSLITLADATPGGAWTKSNTNVNVGVATGTVTGVTAGVTTITYTLPAGCYVTKTVTIVSSPGAIAGTLSLCAGSVTTLTDPVSGGMWTSASPGVATIGSASGLVSGLAAGTAVITYSIGSGCVATAVVTVTTLPALITGTTSVCAGGATTALSDATTGGMWSTASVLASVSGTGVVTGISSGTATITYTAGGCYRTTIVTVNPLPALISGPLALCVGAVIPLSDVSAGGTWSSSTTSVAAIGSASGLLTGITTGTTTITYTLPTGCRVTTTETVSTSPGPISGATSVCAGATVTLSDIVPGGTWTSGGTGTATIGSLSGIVTGVTAGTVVITYSLGSGCTATRAITVVAAPATISGISGMCVGATATLTDATPGGLWLSGTTGTATIGTTSGLVTAIAAGTTTITYTVTGTGCSATKTITVNPAPTAIGGPASVCVGLTVTETDAVAGGTWSTASSLVTIDGSTGMVTGVAPGTASITYSIGSCVALRTITVNAASPIAGVSGLCVASTTTLTDATPGGVWTSSTPAVATIGSSTGTVSGLIPGTTTITYTLPSGCTATKTITVNSGPAPIGGTFRVCVSGGTLLTDAAGGGTWTSSNTSIATIGSSSGSVSGITAGTVTITYSLGSGCTVTAPFTVNPLPAAITGPSSLCMSSTATLADATPGGSWTSSNPTICSIGSASGIASGIAPGSVSLSYTLPTGCAATRTETITAGPAPIMGAATVCVEQSITLTDATPGGSWSSTTTPVATVGTGTGIVTGMIAGTITVTYTIAGGCYTTIMVTVNPLPSPIAGASVLCSGTTTTLTDATPGGTWISGSPSIATIGSSSGTVSGITTGTSVITYTTGSGCRVTKTLTVTSVPSAITGPANILCVGTAITLTDSTPGGTWTSSNIIVATAGSATGLVTGLTAGTATITYSIGSGCTVTKPITVNPAPPAITGTNHICVSGSATLSIATTGGYWSSGNPLIATVGSTTGSVMGISGGAVTISYNLSAGCIVTYGVTVNAVPAITGLTPLCAWGDTLTIHNTDPTGSYSSTGATIVNLGGGNGRITTFAPGTSTVTYTVSSGCSITQSFTVNPLPAPITGTLNICTATSTTLHNATPSGTWTSSTPTIATIGSTSGTVAGLATGITIITYTLPTGCKTDTTIHVYPPPTMIIGYPTMVIGTTGLYTSATPAGTWTSATPTLLTIGSTTGLAHATTTGLATINYTITTTGCTTTKSIRINPLTGVSTPQIRKR